MENNALIDALPLWALCHHETEKEAPLGTMVGATLGLLAFILAFTFGLAGRKTSSRKCGRKRRP